MKIKLFESLSQPLQEELPTAETMELYLDQNISSIRKWSEDLRETEFYLGKPWLEVSDDPNAHDIVLHYFNPEGEYIKSEEGEVNIGKWRFLGGNKLMKGNRVQAISDHDEEEDVEDWRGELYDLAFLDSQFFILRKHGHQRGDDKRKYFVMVFEPVGKNLEWHEVMLKLFNTYRNNNNFYYLLAIIMLLLVMIMLLLS